MDGVHNCTAGRHMPIRWLYTLGIFWREKRDNRPNDDDPLGGTLRRVLESREPIAARDRWWDRSSTTGRGRLRRRQRKTRSNAANSGRLLENTAGTRK